MATAPGTLANQPAISTNDDNLISSLQQRLAPPGSGRRIKPELLVVALKLSKDKELEPATVFKLTGITSSATRKARD